MKMLNDGFDNLVYDYVRSVPEGKVVTYGQVARAIGRPNSARRVGRALHHNPAFGEIPCHRVVFADGRLAERFAFGGASAQAELLRLEGVEVEACLGAVSVDHVLPDFASFDIDSAGSASYDPVSEGPVSAGPASIGSVSVGSVSTYDCRAEERFFRVDLKKHRWEG